MCPITGATEGLKYRKVFFSWYPPWANIFLLLGLIPGALIVSFMTSRAEGEMPFDSRAWYRWKIGGALLFITAIGAVLGVILGLFQESVVLRVAAVVVSVGIP